MSKLAARRPLLVAFGAVGVLAALMLGLVVRDRRSARQALLPPPVAIGTEGEAVAQGGPRSTVEAWDLSRPDRVRVEASHGLVWTVAQALRTPAVIGRILPLGAAVALGAPDAQATLVYGDGTQIILQGLAALSTDVHARATGRSPGTRGLFLSNGFFELTVPRSAAPVTVATAQADVVVSGGAQSRIWSAGATTRIEPIAGSLSLTSGQSTSVVTLIPGQQASVDASGRVQVLGLRRRVALFVTGAVGLDADDQLVRARLERLGFSVRVTAALTPLLHEQVTTVALVLLSSTVASEQVDPVLGAVAAPLITWEEKLFERLGLTAPCAKGGCGKQSATVVTIADKKHPLAAGQSGDVTLGAFPTLHWGNPGPDGVVVATVFGEPTRAAVFAYEKDAAMPGGFAAGRRVGLFLARGGAQGLSASGWTLFDAAVAWAASPWGRK